MAGKNSLRDRAKSLWIKGMNTIGNTAAHIADNTRHKVDELTIQNRRREVRTDVASTVYALWLKGETFPETVTKMLVELKQLDDQLNDLRAEKYAPAERQTVSEADMDGELPSDEKEAATGEAEKKPLENVPETAGLKAMEAPASPVQSEINGYFDDLGSVENMAEKVNSTLSQMSDRIRSFPAEETEDSGGKSSGE